MAIARELALDPVTGDLRVVGGRLVVLSGEEAVAQRIAVRLRTFEGEWIFDTSLGTPYFQNILGTRRREKLIQSILRKRVADTPGVLRVIELSVTIDGSTRVAAVTGKVQVEGGTGIPVSLEVGV